LTGCFFNPGGLMAALKLPKAARLTRRAEFAMVREQGTAQHGKFMVLGIWQSPSPEAARFGVIAARRTGPAHERNRARRRLREIFRSHRPSLPAGIWMVVVLRGSAVRATFAALAGEWRALASRAGYLKV
jgi:ribonuclease P protein component